MAPLELERLRLDAPQNFLRELVRIDEEEMVLSAEELHANYSTMNG
jgi:hypothetical protein